MPCSSEKVTIDMAESNGSPMPDLLKRPGSAPSPESIFSFYIVGSSLNFFSTCSLCR